MSCILKMDVRRHLGTIKKTIASNHPGTKISDAGVFINYDTGNVVNPSLDPTIDIFALGKGLDSSHIHAVMSRDRHIKSMREVGFRDNGNWVTVTSAFAMKDGLRCQMGFAVPGVEVAPECLFNKPSKVHKNHRRVKLRNESGKPLVAQWDEIDMIIERFHELSDEYPGVSTFERILRAAVLAEIEYHKNGLDIYKIWSS